MLYGLYSYLFTLILPRWKNQSPETWDSIILCVSVCLAARNSLLQLTVLSGRDLWVP